jgi:CheY-like chemotaxis protein/predicted regulator of Ras-like GTPase activity (Roadblock/LC7/MglB family)
MPRVLIVDDSLTVRKVVERILESRQLEVLQASLGTEAIERIQRDEPDLVVCDVLLPDKEGYEVCQFVKSHPRLDRTPVLLISGIVNPAVVDRAARVGSAGVIQKPFSADELAGRVSHLLGMAAPASAGAATGNGTIDTMAAAARSLTPSQVARVRLPERSAPTLAGCLAGLAATEGVHSVVLTDRGGQLIGAAGDASDATMLGALTACVASASDEVGSQLERGGVQGLILEHARGLVLVSQVGDCALLTLVLDEPAALGKARYYVKRAVPDLLGVL